MASGGCCSLIEGSLFRKLGEGAAQVVGIRPAEINRMASSFEHDDLKGALAL